MDKRKIGIYGGLFLIVLSIIGTIWTFLGEVKISDMDKTKIAEGIVTKLNYRAFDRGSLHYLYISLKDDKDIFHIPNVSALKEHNGCYLANLKVGDEIQIKYAPDGYNTFNEEKNAVWRIENKKTGQVILSEENIFDVEKKLRKHHYGRGLLFFFMGLLLSLSCLFGWRLICGVD